MKSLNKQPSESSVYIWNIAGSIANALLSVVLLMLVTRTLDDKQADIFSVAWTISQLMVTIGTFQIRTYQATDVKGVFKFQQYFIFRILTISVMMLCSLVYVIVRGYDGYKSLIVLLLCLVRAADSMADVYEGWFQQKERLDLAGKALTFRIMLASAGFGATLIFTGRLTVACAVLLAGYVLCFFVYDVRYNRVVDKLKDEGRWGKGVQWFLKMFAEGVPLFVNAFIMMSITNEPKMVIDTAIERGNMIQGGQTIYNILFMPASVLTLAYIVFRPMITQMAIVWNNKKVKGFLKILAKILGCLLGIGMLLMAGSALLGIPVLSLVYAVNLSAYKNHLLIIIVGGCFYTFAAVLDNALVVIRKQYLLVLAYIVTWIYIKMTTGFFVTKWEVLGASWAYTTAMLIFLCSTVILFVICFWRACKKDK